MSRTRYSGGLETPLSQFSMLRFGIPSSSARARLSYALIGLVQATGYAGGLDSAQQTRSTQPKGSGLVPLWMPVSSS